MIVAFRTLGCKLNQSETEALAGAYQRAGFVVARPGERADIVIINSCTVTARSDAKTRHETRLAAAAHPSALIVLTGCYAEVEYDFLRRELGRETGTAVVPQGRKSILLDFAAAAVREPGFPDFSRPEKKAFFDYFLSGGGSADSAFRLVPDKFIYHSRAFLKIQDGCDGVCAYCRVPLARGKARSLDYKEVIGKLAEIINAGFAEVVFTGVNISAYRSGPHDLASLLEYAIGHSRHVRFRLSSLEPETIRGRLLDVIGHEAICPHVHVPVQSGSDRVLDLMRRRYHRPDLERAVAGLKARKPGLFLAADFIAGFPGETDLDFSASLSFARLFGFAALHVFPFSARPGTRAWSLPGRVPPAVLKKRTRALIDLGGELNARWLEGLSGTEADVILERRERAGVWSGSSAHSIKCRVHGVPPEERHSGARMWVRLTAAGRVSAAEFLRAADGKPAFS